MLRSELWRPYHHFLDSLFFFMLKIVLKTFCCMFEVIVMLLNRFGANQMPPWWYCVMDKYLPVLFSTEETSNSDQIPNSVCRNAAPNLQGPSTMLHCCLQTVILVQLCSPLANKLPSTAAKYLKFWLISPGHLLPFICTPVKCFHA